MPKAAAGPPPTGCLRDQMVGVPLGLATLEGPCFGGHLPWRCDLLALPQPWPGEGLPSLGEAYQTNPQSMPNGRDSAHRRKRAAGVAATGRRSSPPGADQAVRTCCRTTRFNPRA